mgnify:CR=1 FL=1
MPQPVSSRGAAAGQLTGGGESGWQALWRETREGLRYVWGWRGLFVMFATLSLIVFFQRPAVSMLPLLVTQHFHGGPTEMGWLSGTWQTSSVLGGLALSAWGVSWSSSTEFCMSCHEMLSGEHPYIEARTIKEIMEWQIHRTPPPPSKRAPDLPPELDDVIPQILGAEVGLGRDLDGQALKGQAGGRHHALQQLLHVLEVVSGNQDARIPFNADIHFRDLGVAIGRSVGFVQERRVGRHPIANHIGNRVLDDLYQFLFAHLLR